MKERILRLPREAARLLRLAAGLCPEAHLVGGSLRDALLGRPLRDLDLAAPGARALSRRLARALGARWVALDEENAVYRVVLAAPGAARQVDVAERQGGILEDLARRDFAINALALPLSPDLPPALPLGRLLDPRGGLRDLSRRLLRCESEEPLREDPLRLLRAFRIAAELGFRIEPGTLSLISRLRHRLLQSAGERIRSELMALLALPGCSRWLKVMDEAGILTALFPELEPARQCALVYYGPGGVLAHSLETAARADFLLHHLPLVLPDLAPRIEEALAEKGEGASLRPLVLLSALLHDVSKPETARRVKGRLRFFGHDEKGAKRAEALLRRLKFSRPEIETVRAVVLHHLRPGNLAASGTVTERAAYRFFRDLGPHALPLLLVCWADHASYLPQARLARLLKAACAPLGEAAAQRLPPEAHKTVFHLRVIAHLLGRLLSGPKPVPERLINGHEVMKTLGLRPGPEVGKWLERIREAQAVGKVRSREEALAFILRKAS